MSKKRLILVTVLSVIGVILLAIGSSYALFTFNVTKNSNFKAIVGNLELSISDTNSEDRIVLNNLEPKKDSVALAEDGYTFTITNTGSVDAFYTVYLDDIIPVGETKERISDSMMKINLSESTVVKSINTRLISSISDRKIAIGILKSGDSITYTLRLWLDYNADNSAQGKYYASRIRIDSTQEKSVVYDSVEKVIAQFKPSELGTSVMCSESNGIYYDCGSYETLNEAFKSRNDGMVVLVDDIETDEVIEVPRNLNVVLDLNGKTINGKLKNAGNLIIEGNRAGGTVTYNSDKGIYNYSVATMTINGGTYINDTGIVIYNDGGKLIIDDGEILGDSSQAIFGDGMSDITINGGTIVSTSNVAVDLYGTGTINGGTITGKRYAIRGQGYPTLKITGGVFIGSISQINKVVVEQTTTPIYVYGLLKSTTSLSIVANQADNCTANPSDTTSGLCLYSDNDSVLSGGIIDGGTYVATGSGNNTIYSYGTMTIEDGLFISNGAETLKNVEGLVTINGGTFRSTNSKTILNTNLGNAYGKIIINGGKFVSNGGYTFYNNSKIASAVLGGTFISYGGRPFYNSNDSSINVKNATITSDTMDAIINYGTLNICDSTISSGRYDIYQFSNNGNINYHNVTFSNGTTTPDSSKISNLSGSMNAVDTCPVSN